MPDPTTPAKGLTQPQVGGDNNTWGGLINADLSLIDSALGGTVSVAISGNTTLTTSQVENTGYEFTGNLSAGATVTWPSFSGFAVIQNNTAGGFAITCGTTGETVVVANGTTLPVWSDGTNFLDLASAGNADIDNIIDVLVIGGQSNAEGVGNSGTSITVPVGKVFQSLAGTITAGNDPFGVGIPGGQAGTGSAWPAFGATYYAATGRKICLVPASYGGTYQVAAAAENAGAGTNHWDIGGTLAPRLITYLNQAISGLLALGYIPRVMGILWCQGENDASGIQGDWESQETYQTALQNMIAYYRSATIGGTTYPQLPFYIFQTGGPSAGDNTYYEQIRAAQEAVAEDDEWARVVFSNAVDFIARGMVNPSAGGSNLHYFQDGYNEMGRIGAINVITGQAGDFWQRAGANPYGVGTRDIYYPRGKVTVGGVPGSGAGGTTSPDSANFYLGSSGIHAAGFSNPQAAGSNNNVIRLANTTVGTAFDQRVGIVGQPAYGGLGENYGGAIIFQQDQATGRSNIEFGGYAAGTWLEFARFSYNGGMLIGDVGGAGIGDSNGRSFGPGSLGLMNAVSATVDNNLLVLANTDTMNNNFDHRVGILGQPAYAIGSGYGGAIIFQHDQETGRTNIEFGGYDSGTWLEFGRWGYTGGLLIGQAGIGANGAASGPGTLTLVNSVAAGSDNNLLYLNNPAGTTADQRVGILMNPSNAGLTTYGRALIASWDIATGRCNLEIGGYDNSVWAEHARFTNTGGFALGVTTDPGSGCMIVAGSITLLPMTAPATPASGSVLYIDGGDSNKVKLKASDGTITVLQTP